jgi:hypothetical protein
MAINGNNGNNNGNGNNSTPGMREGGEKRGDA